MSNLYRAMLLAEERRKAQEAAKKAAPVERAAKPVEKDEEPRAVGRPKSDRPKQIISIRLDADLLDHYRATGAGWQSRINEDLKKAVGLEKAK